jgi:hypothetical protein
MESKGKGTDGVRTSTKAKAQSQAERTKERGWMGRERKGRKERNALEIYSTNQGNIPNKRLIPFALLAGIACQVLW